jgi:2-polyprenyl-6-methoxyphenol hydroxylase-like FAD-dependent oxidoreductase
MINAHCDLRSFYDVVIAGGGPAGVATGIDLARSGFTALIADAGPRRRLPIGETLQAEAFHELFRLGYGDSFLGDGHRRSYGM